jgi:hypothetical protein
MTAKPRSLQVYEELATWYDRQGQAKLRDWFLVLAADTAQGLGQVDQAERLRQRLLHVNPHHLLRPFKSFAEALQSPDVRGYVADLRRNYPPETAEQLLQSTWRKKPAEPTRAAAPAPRGIATDKEKRELKVYRGRETPEEPIPVAEEVPEPVPPKPAPPPRMPAPVAWTKPAPAPVTRGTLADPEPDLDDEGPTGLGYWVSSLLFVVTLLVGALLLAYSLARPFLPL